jgi:hypothetical protein
MRRSRHFLSGKPGASALGPRGDDQYSTANRFVVGTESISVVIHECREATS